jgi:hypothetical protein
MQHATMDTNTYNDNVGKSRTGQWANNLDFVEGLFPKQTAFVIRGRWCNDNRWKRFSWLLGPSGE